MSSGLKWILQYPSHFGYLAKLNSLSRNPSSETVFQGKSLNLHHPYHTESRLCVVRFDRYKLNLLFL